MATKVGSLSEEVSGVAIWSDIKQGDSVILRPKRVVGDEFQVVVEQVLERRLGEGIGLIDSEGNTYRQWYYDLAATTNTDIMRRAPRTAAIRLPRLPAAPPEPAPEPESANPLTRANRIYEIAMAGNTPTPIKRTTTEPIRIAGIGSPLPDED